MNEFIFLRINFPLTKVSYNLQLCVVFFIRRRKGNTILSTIICRPTFKSMKIFTRRLFHIHSAIRKADVLDHKYTGVGSVAVCRFKFTESLRKF